MTTAPSAFWRGSAALCYYGPPKMILESFTLAALAGSAALWSAIWLRLRQIRHAELYLDSGSAPAAPAESEPPLVSILVPARNEERDLAPCLRALRAQDYPRTEIVFIDDQSTDRTAAIARAELAGAPGARLLAGRPRPGEGWTGKSWALAQAVPEARGEYLLFSDADIVHHPRALSQAVAELRALELDALSIMPAIDCQSRWEKIVMPLFALLAGLVEPLDKANRPGARDCRMSGAFILIRRAAYAAVGGHEAVRGEILEDMALARRLKEAGRPLRLVYTHDLSRTRMYDRLRDAWQGLARVSYPMLKYSPALLLVAWGASLLGTVVPWLAVAGGALAALLGRPCGGAAALAGAALVAVQPWVLSPCFRMLRVKRRWALCLPVAALLMCLAAGWSAWRHHTGQGLAWKDRVYR
jgi:chlorobactene glucosyltransferase